MVGRRIARLAVTMLLVSGCSNSPAATEPPGAVATPTIAAATPTTTALAPTTTPPDQPTPRPTITLPDMIDLGTTTAIAIKATPNPDFIVLAGGYAFASGVGKGIGRFDGTTGALIDSLLIDGGTCEALDAGFGSAWTATCSGPGLVRIDPATGATTSIDLDGHIPDSEASIGAGEGGVWIVVGNGDRELIRVDPATNTVSNRYPIKGSVEAVRAGLGAVWVSDSPLSVIHRVDPASGAIVATINVGTTPQFLAVGEGAVWTMNQDSGSVSRIDPATNTVVATIELGEQVRGGDIAVGGGYLWLRGSRTLLFQIDPATNEIVARYGPPAGSGSVAADDTAVWITAHDITTIWRLEYSGVVE